MPDTPLSLLARLQQRPDADVWRQLVNLYTPFLQNWLRREGVSPGDVDDLVQDVPDQAAFRIDFPLFLEGLTERDRRLAEYLALTRPSRQRTSSA